MAMEEGEWVMPTSIILLLFLFVTNLFVKIRKGNHKNLPPSPPVLPLIGHLHLLSQPLHRSLHKLTDKYGPILFLRFGTRNVLLVSSSSAVEECFTTNDIVFAHRPRTLVGKHLGYNYKTIGSCSYGQHWRNLRRLTTLELFSAKRLAIFTGIRQDEVKLLVKQLFQDSRGQLSEVNLRARFVELAFNTMLRIISGKRYYGKDVVAQEAKQFQALMKDFTELQRTGSLNDFFPILQWVDFHGVEKKMVNLMNKMDSFLQNLLDEHRRNRCMSASNNNTKMTLIDVMLSLQQKEPEFYTDENIKGVILTSLVAGSETSASTMEWAVSLLLNHPEAMHKARAEIDIKVGEDRLVNESDLPKLKYLDNVITETLRLFPVVPLLLPHESSNDCRVGGFDVPGGTTLLANLWSMQRDGKLWVDPTRFWPERFEGGSEEGEGYKMIPFGAGRRACPGAVLAKRVMGLAIGSLIHMFEWERIGHQQINMAEGTGVTVPKLEPLVALCKPRQLMLKLLSNL